MLGGGRGRILGFRGEQWGKWEVDRQAELPQDFLGFAQNPMQTPPQLLW